MRRYFLLSALILFAAFSAAGQNTMFSYQGSLQSNSLPANANYDFQVGLFQAATGGTAIATQTLLNIPVTNGSFTLQLDLGSNFPGAGRRLEIAVRPAGGASYTVLSPRVPILSVPYAIRSIDSNFAVTSVDSQQLGGVAASQYVLTSDPRLSDARPPLPGGSGYVQNTTTQQASSNFNISGDGTAGGTLTGNAVNSATQYNIGGNRVLSIAGTSNLFAGLSAGAGSTGIFNTYVGTYAGQLNGDGYNNSFLGYRAGALSGSASQNAYFGNGAGENSTGDFNVAVGVGAGVNLLSASNNTFIGHNANASSPSLNYATAIGAESSVSNSNSVVLGRNLDTVRIPGGLNVTGSTFLGGVFVVSNGSLATFTGSASVSGNLSVSTLGSAGATALCRNASNQIATCSSSLRYKSGVTNFTPGLDIVNRLRPISFSWRDGGMKDVGFGAEEIAKIDDRFVTYNDKGEVEGVKYDRLSVAFVNAFKEQQEQISEQRTVNNKQRKQIEAQQKQIEELRSLVCEIKPGAKVCKRP